MNLPNKINYPLPSTVIQANVELLTKREEVGLAKYGHTLDRTDLSVEELTQHFLEEMLDGANYAQAFLREMAKARQQEAALKHQLDAFLRRWQNQRSSGRFSQLQCDALSKVITELEDMLHRFDSAQLLKDLR